MVIKKDIAGLEDLVAWLESHPEKHDQTEWVAETYCGTTGCAAGWKVLLDKSSVFLKASDQLCNFDLEEDAMRLVLWEQADTDYLLERGGLLPGEESMIDGFITHLDDGRKAVHVAVRAARLLGLRRVEADRFFSADNTVEQMKKTVKDWSNEEKP